MTGGGGNGAIRRKLSANPFTLFEYAEEWGGGCSARAMLEGGKRTSDRAWNGISPFNAVMDTAARCDK